MGTKLVWVHQMEIKDVAVWDNRPPLTRSSKPSVTRIYHTAIPEKVEAGKLDIW